MAASNKSNGQSPVQGVSPFAERRRLSFTDITGSSIFTILIGPTKKEHTMHSALLEKQSTVLKSLVSNGMKESANKFLDWGHVSEHTFSKFSQYAYTGGFSIVQPEEIASRENKTIQATAAKVTSDWLIKVADLIIFADCYGIDGLNTSASSKLQAALNQFHPNTNEAIQAATDLFQYSFTGEKPQILQDIVKKFLMNQYSVLWQNEDFRNTIKPADHLCHVLMDCMASRKQGVAARCTNVQCQKHTDIFDTLNKIRHCGMLCELVYSESGRIPKCE